MLGPVGSARGPGSGPISPRGVVQGPAGLELGRSRVDRASCLQIAHIVNYVAFSTLRCFSDREGNALYLGASHSLRVTLVMGEPYFLVYYNVYLIHDNSLIIVL